ncbi:translation initiation factor IF-2 [Oceanibacterium hippocampi]|uniref:Translation initiation factor IF-2 n=1 Tax=Oceanibacterium hippocampi TaxID=745714 RepID=A0A1Y5RJP6_9PROT|nr:translation initiation factor IF-2 [Oceanibacterium hippocampi]SLN19148.1 Translation initiation factor IF-2 [Oceanibacterium hippocampi]
MSEANDKDERKSLSLNKQPRKLEMRKGPEGGQVRQSFSHGRSKTVQVEVRKKRVPPRPGTTAGQTGETTAPKPEPAAAPAVQAKPSAPAPAPQKERPRNDQPRHATRGRVVLKQLTAEEKAARVRALHGARKEAAEARVKAEEEARERDFAERREAEERAAAERRQQEEEDRKRNDADARRRSEEEAAKRLAEEHEAKRKADAEAARERQEVSRAAAPAAARAGAPEEREGDSDRGSPRGATKARRGKTADRAVATRRGESRRTGRLTVTDALVSGDGRQRQRSLAAVRRAREKARSGGRGDEAPTKVVRDVVVPETIVVQELANRMAERGVDVVRALMKMGVMVTINQPIDADTAELLVSEFGHRIRRVSDSDVEVGLSGDDDPVESLKPRAPVVTVMGHVDHGKTSLLDALRKTDVVSREAGGITQHIGAYQVELSGGATITFLDTPGHEAFTGMRSRGAKVTDIVILVVAADDAVMPQTIEAIRHAKLAEVPIIVAINKCDLPAANPDKVRQQLLQHEIVVESLGGDVQDVEVSAAKGTGLDKLQEAILLQSEILELKANPDRNAEGVVVEAKLEVGRGSVATVLVQRGTLRIGDVFVAGAEWGRVRALIDDRGNNVESAGPAEPVEVIGLQGAPEAGDLLSVIDSESRARDIAEFRQRQSREKRAAVGQRGTLEQMFSAIKEGQAQLLPLVIKADVQGSAEALVGSAEKIGTDEVKVEILHSAVGGINESDVILARASNGIIIGFNVRANKQAREMAQRDGVDIRYYSIIYNVIDDLKSLLSGMLAPAVRERFLGYAEIREVFNITKTGKVAGCMITEGVVRRGCKVRLLRDDVVIHEGDLSSLRRFKDEVREVKQGAECGMALANYQDIQTGDMIECFELEEVERTL